MEIELEQIGDDIWIINGKCVSFYGFPYPTRSVVIRLASGKLWIWSPIAISDSLKQQIDELGDIAHLVSPNKIHHLFLEEWQDHYPKAKLWGPKSTIDKRSDLSFGPELDDDAPKVWSQDIEQIWVRGSLAMDEIIFFHKKSKTLIMADLSEHFSESFLQRHWSFWQRSIAQAWGIIEGKGYAPLEWRLSFLNRRHLKRAKARFTELNPENVVMAHGEWQSGNGLNFLHRAFKWV